MGYAIATRYEVRGTLVCLSPVHVGGWDHTADAHLTVIRDGADRPILPGTSIAGALRAYLSRLEQFQSVQEPTPVQSLFGRITPKTQEGSPSWVRIDDAYLMDESVTPVVATESASTATPAAPRQAISTPGRSCRQERSSRCGWWSTPRRTPPHRPIPAAGRRWSATPSKQ